MPYLAKVFKVLIASPGDTVKEKSAIRNAIQNWNIKFSESSNAVLIPHSWETSTAPEMGGEPQSVINRQLVDKCDFLIAIFKTKIGTETEKYISGTVEEIKRHINAGKPASIYFSNVIENINNIDTEQLEELRNFKESIKGSGLYHEINKLEGLENKVENHINIILDSNSYFSDSEITNPDFIQFRNVTSSEVDEISDDAVEILIEAAKDPQGHIDNLSFIGGTRIATNGKIFVDQNSSKREVARWKSVLEELSSNFLIESLNYENSIYEVTHRGYEFIESLD